jgi:hypothetical protein
MSEIYNPHLNPGKRYLHSALPEAFGKRHSTTPAEVTSSRYAVVRDLMNPYEAMGYLDATLSGVDVEIQNCFPWGFNLLA